MPGKRIHLLALLVVLVFLAAGCATRLPRKAGEAPLRKGAEGPRIPATQRPYQINGKTYYPLPSAEGFEEQGIASWYGADFHGRRTSCGETYNMHGLTAAHKTLPMDTWILVKNLENDREVTVRVNDRGPFSKERILDLTRTAADALGFLGRGTAPVRITALGETAVSGAGGIVSERFLSHPDYQSGDFFVQIGSFVDENNARRLKERMLALGHKSQLSRFERDGQAFFRVQVGAGRELSGAREIEQTMEQAGFPDAFVIAQ
ncbi:MAG: septal ring lytic transglycosylase RlpA family protein [Desulfobulbaceae bacterium]|nr:septal ring lytic transglycosylase RlpA family protein [Desulfobulbaceae bacterium]